MSALRINLLPAYIADVRRTKVAIIAVVATLLAAGAGTFVVYNALKQTTETKESDATAMEQQASTATAEVNKIKNEASGLRSKIAPIEDKVNFVKDIRFYNTWVQKIYRRAARYTDARIEYSSMAVSGSTISMSGYAQNVDDLARYLITFYGNPDVTAVSVSGPPGWQRPAQTINSNPLAGQSAAASSGFPFQVTATLLRGLQRPTIPASLQSAPTVTGDGGSKPATSAPGAPPTAPTGEDR